VKRLLALLLTCCVAPAFGADALRVCADPDNLPYSREDGSGFENRIAQLLADDLKLPLAYAWLPDRRGFVRKTLGAQLCDVIIGVPAGFERAATTQPYYRSAYVLVERASEAPPIRTLADARLATLRIGVQLIGDDGANTPPTQALARRGIVDQVHGYMVYGDYRDRTPQSPIVDAVAAGDIDVAIVWGPTAGYFASKQPVPITLTPVSPWLDGPQWPMVFDISMAVRKDDRALRRELNRAIERQAPAIAAVLREYHVPLSTAGMAASSPSPQPAGTQQ